MFEGAHFHLLVNHVSLFALLFGVVVLAANFKWGGRDVLFVALGLFVVAGVFTWLAHESGETAEHLLKPMMSDLEKTLFKEHELAAKFATIAGYLTAVVALVCGWVAIKKPTRLKVARIVTFVVALWATSVFARVAYLGGFIRHAEIRSGSPAGTTSSPGAVDPS
jgi:hypothetical protein